MPKKILIIDDDKDMSEILSFEFSRLGYEIISAHDGEEGYLKYKEIRPHLIILDLRLPKLTGNALCRRIRRDDEDSKVAIIMLTALDDDADRIIGRVQGANLYVTKPYERTYLISAVKEILGDN